MTIEKRRRELLRIIHYAPHTSVSELAMRLEVSERTIRRDLKHIREGGGVPACTKPKGYDVKVDAPGGPLMGLDDAWVIQIVENHPEIGRQDGGLFWRPNSAGYTRFIAEAGIYTEAEAKREQGLTDRPRDVARRLVDVLIGKKIEGSVGAALFEKLTELERLKSTLGLPGGPTKDEVVSAYLGDDGRMSKLRQALAERRKLYFTYRDVATDNRSEYIVQPRSIVFRGDHWSLLGWCEAREEYRSFRPKRMRDVCVMAERFAPSDAPKKKVTR